MKTNKTKLIIAGILISAMGYSQTVSTFFQTTCGTDVAVDKNGDVYVSNATAEVRKIQADGSYDESFVAGGTLTRATGLAFDPSGETLYVACRPANQLGWITKINLDGTDEILASNLYLPGDITVDPAGNLYVTQWNNKIKKITPSGEVSLYVNLTTVNTSLGIAWTPGDTLYVASAHDGNIYKVIPGIPVTVEYFAHVDGLQQAWACGYMAYWSGNLYITNGDNKIHQISLDGTVTDYAGSGEPGWVDGPADSAQFYAPNGIGFNMDGSKMFVTEWTVNRVRVIEDLATAVHNTNKTFIDNVLCFPNPFVSRVVIDFNLSVDGFVSVFIYNIQGAITKTLSNKNMMAGHQQLTWNGEDELGKRVVPGTYYCAIVGRNQQQSIPIQIVQH